MARIRSIHPGLATDEAYMAMSIYAKASWPMLWTECDDHGVFEWKPLVLKARIFPVDTINFEQLLDEWIRLGCIQKIELGGKAYGLVRNFCRYQRPKKPSYRVELPVEHSTYIGLKPDSSEPGPHQDGTGTGKSPQMEEEGGSGRREEEQDSSSLRSERAREDRSGRRKARTALPLDWQPPDDVRVHVASLGFSSSEVTLQIERFRANALKNDQRCADWPEALKGWFLKALELAGKSLPDPDKPAEIAGIYLLRTDPRFEAWERATGKSYPTGKGGGYFFPTEKPPAEPEAIPPFLRRTS
jgi:hypothetical protein